MKILKISTLLAILLKCVIASESSVRKMSSRHLKRMDLGASREIGGKWQNRNDLFDYVVTKNVEFIIGFINQVEDAKIPTLAALFIKRSDIVDQVLKKIKYDDYDLICLTTYRPELAESHEDFFKVIDKIKDPKNQEVAVDVGCHNLFDAKKHDSVIPLIDALEKRPFKSRNLMDVAIQRAFYEGAKRGIKDIVEEFHEHPAITSAEICQWID